MIKAISLAKNTRVAYCTVVNTNTVKFSVMRVIMNVNKNKTKIFFNSILTF